MLHHCVTRRWVPEFSVKYCILRYPLSIGLLVCAYTMAIAHIWTTMIKSTWPSALYTVTTHYDTRADCNVLFVARQCMQELIFFSTGLKQVPHLGFTPSPTISFLHNTEEDGRQSRFPKANTCSCCLQLCGSCCVWNKEQSWIRLRINLTASQSLI